MMFPNYVNGLRCLINYTHTDYITLYTIMSLPSAPTIHSVPPKDRSLPEFVLNNISDNTCIHPTQTPPEASPDLMPFR